MINWSLPSESKLRGSHFLIGTSLPNFINILMNKTSANNLFYDLNTCTTFCRGSRLKKYRDLLFNYFREIRYNDPCKKWIQIKNTFKNSNIEVLDDCGHFHIQEKSSEVRKIISKYISK